MGPQDANSRSNRQTSRRHPCVTPSRRRRLHSRRTRTTRAQFAYYKRAVAALVKWKKSQAQAVNSLQHRTDDAHRADAIVTGNPCRTLATKIRNCNSNHLRNIRCREGICPRCRYDRIQARASAAVLEFAKHPSQHIFFATVLIRAERRLFDCAITTSSPQTSRNRWPTDSEISFKTRQQIERACKELDAAFRTLRSTTLLVEGAFEFAVVNVRTCGTNKSRFLNDLGFETGPSAPGPDVAVLHLHFVVAAKTGHAYIPADEIAEAIRRRFPHRFQVMIMPLRIAPSPQTEVVRVISYAWKSFTDFRPARVAEIALTLSKLGFRRLRFSRRWNRTRRPSPTFTSQTPTNASNQTSLVPTSSREA
jgi:hypothetical protein